MIEAKQAPSYTDTSINHKSQEKSMGMIGAVAERLQDPNSDGTFRIVEVGPGGGIALGGLCAYLSEREISSPIDLTVMEAFSPKSPRLKLALSGLENLGIPSRVVVSKAQEIPLIDGGADVVNASGVMHEIYSYGGGYIGLWQAFDEISRILRPGGLFIYRDVLGLEDDLHKPTQLDLKLKSWQLFTHKFLPYFLQNSDHPYGDDEVKMGDIKGGLSIQCPAGLSREIQRHYITFRDSMWQSRALGFWPLESFYGCPDWINEDEKIKKVYFGADDHKDTIMLLNGLVERDKRGISTDSLTFDDVTDLLIGRFLEEPCTNSNFIKAYNNWQDREGAEVYVYASPEDIVSLVRPLGLETTEEGIRILPREYYTGYLGRTLEGQALQDGKCYIKFIKQEQVTDG